LGGYLGVNHSVLALFSGFLAGYWNDSLGVFGQAVREAGAINPTYILSLFLPMIVFKASMDMNWFVFRKQIMQSLLLAYPGVLLGSLLLMLSMQLAFGGFIALGWTESLMFGIILSCTDTASLLQTLRRLGAPIKLSSLIEGESLFNDGSCIVFFTILLATLRDGHSLFIVSQFVINTVGGAVLGLLVGGLARWWINHHERDVIQVLNSIILGYIILWILCDQDLWASVHHPSRIVAVTIYGLMMAIEKERVPKSCLHALKIFWQYAEFMAETFIYWMTGIIISTEVSSLDLVWHLDSYVYVLLLYLMVMVTRGLSQAILYTWTKRMGYGLDRSEAALLSLGGQRGPICLTLALILTRQSDQSTASTIKIFCATGVVLLSVLVNGNLTPFLIKRSRVIKAGRMRIRTLITLLARIIKSTEESFNENRHLQSLINMQPLQRLLEASKKELELAIASDKQYRNIGNVELNEVLASVLRGQGHREGLTEYLIENDTMYVEEEMYEVRVKMLQGFKSILYEYKNENKCSLDSWMILSEAVNLDLHQPHDTISSFEWIEEQFSPFFIRIFLYLSEVPLFGHQAQLIVLRMLCL
jgi:NhaP-type Na+/H+ or K+/H+ antiporter